MGTKTSVAESCIGISFFSNKDQTLLRTGFCFEKFLSLAMEAGLNWGLGFGFFHANFLSKEGHKGSREFVSFLRGHFVKVVCRMILPQVHLR